MSTDQPLEIALVGNPNCGKTTLFNALTGSRQRVGNWPGVTVERKVGDYQYAQQRVQVVDLPGIYETHVYNEQGSIDEKIACEYLLSHQADLIINVVDASHLERNLYLTLQLLEMGMPMILVANMLDVAEKNHLGLNLAQLSQKLGCPVIGIKANSGEGLPELREAIEHYRQQPPSQSWHPPFRFEIEQNISELQLRLPPNTPLARWLALRLLEGDTFAEHYLMATITPESALEPILQTRNRLQQHLQQQLAMDIDIAVAEQRYQFIQQCVSQVMAPVTTQQTTISSWLDRIFLHRLLGIPLFLAVMYVMFFFAINVGGALQDFFDITGNTLFVEGLSHWLNQLGAADWLIAIIAGGAGLGITTTLTFIPVLGAMFLFLSFLEASGYMARAAFVMDRLMRSLGLPGKAFVPMIVGFGCNVPAIMGARTLENPRDRLLTILMSPFMSCSARLAIYAVFVSAFFPHNGQNVIFALYFIGIAAAVLTGLLLRKTFLRGAESPLIMELPSYHLPTAKALLLNTWHRLKSFLTRASKVIIPLCIIIGFLNTMTLDGELNFDESDQESLLAYVGQQVTPVFSPMGISQENWPATVGIATGLLAKEVVVATLNTLYSQVGELEQATQDESFSVTAGLTAAVASIPENLLALADSLVNPIAASAQDSEITDGVYGEMWQRFDSHAGAFAYLLFLLLYFPCVSTTAVMVREASRAWTLFSIAWTSALAYAVAVIFYQAATLSRHPQSSLLWIGGLLLLFTAIILLMRRLARTTANPQPLETPS